jgi:hypothetical protein
MADEGYQADTPEEPVRSTEPRRAPPPDDKVQPEPHPEKKRRATLTPIDDDEDDYRTNVRRRGPSGVEAMIPYKNPLALIAYYLGVFGLIPVLGLLLGPIALVMGILGVRFARNNPTAGGAGHAITGIVLGILASLLNWGVVIAMVVGIAIFG